jgi:protein adenylyltransferase
MDKPDTLAFDNSYAQLPPRFFARQNPTPVAQPGLILANRPLAVELGIDPDWLESAEGVSTVAGNSIPAGAEPIATAYAGHQFGGWNPQLGDGRAVLLGEMLSPNGQRFDFQLKGSGPTPWSRGGDGRAPIGPVLREYILSEAMAVLGVPTTRALAAVTTGERVMREGSQPGAVLARVAKSHIRIGTFQYFFAREDTEALRLLADHVISRHYPKAAATENPYLSMLNGVIDRQATLIARWQSLGFIHGVMNTDNMLLSGETVDYGPCAFIDGFHPDTVFSSIDHAGRYAYSNQPAIGHWNLSNLAQCLLPLIAADTEEALPLAQGALDNFPEIFLQQHLQLMQRKLGLNDKTVLDSTLIEDLLALMAAEKTDFTLTFRRLSDLSFDGNSSRATVADLFELPSSFEPWLQRWRQCLAADSATPATRQATMDRVNPVFIPRNHLVEEVIQAALYDGDMETFVRLGRVLEQPFDFRTDLARYALGPQPGEVVSQTFCGT